MRERVYVKRKHDKKSWKKIAGEVRKRKGKHPYWEVVRAAFKVLSTDKNQKGKDKGRGMTPRFKQKPFLWHSHIELGLRSRNTQPREECYVTFGMVLRLQANIFSKHRSGSRAGERVK